VGDFAMAVKFTKLAHAEKYEEAGELVVPESAAARYLAHQALVRKADRIAGTAPENEEPSIKGDPATGTVKIKFTGEEKLTYTWRDFTFEQSKITGWPGKSGPVQKVLWTRATSDESHGVKAKLESAYLSNAGNLLVTVELSSSRSVGFRRG
jgi:hypothetical protein